MADKKKRTEIAIDDSSFESASAVPVVMDDLEDEITERQPIDLDAPIESFIPVIESEEEATADVATIDSAALADLRRQVDEASDKYLRTLAEFQNYKRRTDDDIRRRVLEGNERLIQQILPAMDDFDLAITAAKSTESYEQLIGGVEAIHRKLADALSRQGVDPIPSLGEPFDASLHEAVMLDEDSDQPDETITAELRKGYTLKGRVIRPSLVKVAKAS